VFRRHLCITTSAEHGSPKRKLLLAWSPKRFYGLHKWSGFSNLSINAKSGCKRRP